MPTKKVWAELKPEQREKYLKNQRDKRIKAKEDAQRRGMLAAFLSAPDAQAKREVIKTFTPHYFVFGNTLNPRKENHETV